MVYADRCLSVGNPLTPIFMIANTDRLKSSQLEDIDCLISDNESPETGASKLMMAVQNLAGGCFSFSERRLYQENVIFQNLQNRCLDKSNYTLARDISNK
jgi:hypothetical protein